MRDETPHADLIHELRGSRFWGCCINACTTAKPTCDRCVFIERIIRALKADPPASAGLPQEEWDYAMMAHHMHEWARLIRLAENQQTLLEIADDLDLNAKALWSWPPSAEGCSGKGRPSCKATECMYGLNQHLQPTGNCCAFTEQLAKALLSASPAHAEPT